MGFAPHNFEIVNDVQIRDEIEDSKKEVEEAQHELKMRKYANSLAQNQKLLEQKMMEYNASQNLVQNHQESNQEQKERLQEQKDIVYSRKFGFQPTHFNIEDSEFIQTQHETYKPGTILDNQDQFDVRSYLEKQDYQTAARSGSHWAILWISIYYLSSI